MIFGTSVLVGLPSGSSLLQWPPKNKRKAGSVSFVRGLCSGSNLLFVG